MAGAAAANEVNPKAITVRSRDEAVIERPSVAL
jgi:hypothetical protein